MKRGILAATISAALVLAAPAAPAHGRSYAWVANNCFDDHHAVSYWKRSDGRAYGFVAAGEGYDYAGGCWNNDDRDDTPPVATDDPGSEGPDCSGLVFKAWFLKNSAGASGGTWYNKFEDTHGPYASWHYLDPTANDPFFRLPDKDRSTTLYMDAFVSQGHASLIYTDVATSGNADYILEARGNFDGTDVFVENYRWDPAYRAVRRRGWTPDCYPRCSAPPRTSVVTIS